MFELYDKDNKIPEELAKQIYDFMIHNYEVRKEYLDKPKVYFQNEEKYKEWYKIITEDENYYLLIYYKNNEPVAFVGYTYIFKGLCLSEVQIKEEYQGKYGILKKMLKKILEITDKTKYNNICGNINNNKKSHDVFTHIGLKNTEKNWYEISKEDLEKWINK